MSLPYGQCTDRTGASTACPTAVSLGAAGGHAGAFTLNGVTASTCASLGGMQQLTPIPPTPPMRYDPCFAGGSAAVCGSALSTAIGSNPPAAGAQANYVIYNNDTMPPATPRPGWWPSAGMYREFNCTGSASGAPSCALMATGKNTDTPPVGCPADAPDGKGAHLKACTSPTPPPPTPRSDPCGDPSQTAVCGKAVNPPMGPTDPTTNYVLYNTGAVGLGGAPAWYPPTGGYREFACTGSASGPLCSVTAQGTSFPMPGLAGCPDMDPPLPMVALQQCTGS
jgi:hypothetical protein